MPGLLRQLFEIVELGAAVAFPEGVDVVHIAHDLPGCHRECRAIQPTEEVCGLEPPVDVRHAGFDEPTKLELVPTLGYFHGPDLARPVIDVLEQMPVDGA